MVFVRIREPENVFDLEYTWENTDNIVSHEVKGYIYLTV